MPGREPMRCLPPVSSSSFKKRSAYKESAFYYVQTLHRVSGGGCVVGCGRGNSHICSVADQAERTYSHGVEPQPSSGWNLS